MEKNRFFKRYSPLFLGTAIILAVDQYTKLLIRRNFELGETISVIDGFFNLKFVLNPGAAFSFLSNVGSPWVRGFFIIVSIFAIALIISIYREVEAENRPFKISLILLLGGAGGNLFDRLILGKVTDFLDFHIQGHHWPTFNVADSCITVAVAAIIIQWVWPQMKRRKY